MTDKKKNGWIKFVPSLDLPKERVSIAYDTHDEKGYRFAHGYFQFYNGTCVCFWKDGNEQPKAVKAEDIKYWMPVPSLDVQEEPVSEDFEAKVKNLWKEINTGHDYSIVDSYNQFYGLCLDIAEWQKEQFEKDYINLCNGIATAKGLAVSMAYDKGVADAKEQLMAKAVDARCFGFQGAALFSFRLPSDKYLVGSEIKVIVIKED